MEDISAINVLLTIVLAHTPTENTIQPQTSEPSSFQFTLSCPIHEYTLVEAQDRMDDLGTMEEPS